MPSPQPGKSPAADGGNPQADTPACEAGSDSGRKAGDDSVLCERCGAEMYRMHAVWRCPACGFKTDCCGW